MYNQGVLHIEYREKTKIKGSPYVTVLKTHIAYK